MGIIPVMCEIWEPNSCSIRQHLGSHRRIDDLDPGARMYPTTVITKLIPVLGSMRARSYLDCTNPATTLQMLLRKGLSHINGPIFSGTPGIARKFPSVISADSRSCTQAGFDES